jgi:hypothetical protein
MDLYGMQILSNVCAQQANNPMVPHVSDAQEGRAGWQELDADVEVVNLTWVQVVR